MVLNYCDVKEQRERKRERDAARERERNNVRLALIRKQEMITISQYIFTQVPREGNLIKCVYLLNKKF